ncbi:MAG: HlyD family type I secretion periplasmic adaptor subunit [Limnobacter sp.]|uniref:HlyD family type I secretion periplasmic adaptor subunit n=1 Tax=Limnobacter sp. TaxID=2003368 RepID=UPI00391A2E2B
MDKTPGTELTVTKKAGELQRLNVKTEVVLNNATGMYDVLEADQEAAPVRSPVIWVVLVTLVIALGWAAWAELDQVTRGTGAIIASQKTQIVQAPDGGVIEELLVREGDVVKPNQLLATLDTAKAGAAVAEVVAKQGSLQASIVRLRAEVLETPMTFPDSLKKYPDIIAAQTRLYQKRRQALNEEVSALVKSLKLIEEELVLNEKALATGDVSKTEVIRLRRQANDLQSQITNRRNKYFQDAQAELAKAEDELATVSQTVNQRQASLDYTRLTAPVGGAVRNVRFTTKGAVLRPGDELLTIVPTADALIVEAKIKPSDIAFIRKGMTANIKVDAYDYSIYGTLEGVVTYISPDTLTDDQGTRQATGEPTTYYRIHVETRDRSFKKRADEQLDLIPGMTTTVEVKTGKSSVLRYLFKPVVKTLDQALVER